MSEIEKIETPSNVVVSETYHQKWAREHKAHLTEYMREWRRKKREEKEKERESWFR